MDASPSPPKTASQGQLQHSGGVVADTSVLFCRPPPPPPQYVGSFTVEDLDLQQQVGRLEEQLRALKVWHPPLLPLTGKWGDPK